MTFNPRRLALCCLWLLGCALPASAAPLRILLLDAAVARDTIVAVGERGAIVTSADSGHTWVARAAPTFATLTGVAFAPDGRHGWAVGHDALVLATTDGGLTWTKAYQGPSLEESFLDVCACDEKRVIAVGAYGQFLESNDGGATWQPRRIEDNDLHFNRISCGPDGTLYLAGERGTLLRSGDGGMSWENIAAPYDGSFYGILPLSTTTLLAYGLRGRIYRSEDKGASWTLIPTEEPTLLATACRLRSGEIVFAGQSRFFFRSRDDGHTVTRWRLPFTVGVAQLLQAPDGRLLAFGEDGVTVLPPP